MTDKERMRELEKIVNDDSDNPHITPTLANPNAYDRFQKAKELATELENEKVLSVVLVQEEHEKSLICIDWLAEDVDLTKVKEFIDCFDRAIIDESCWHLYLQVYK